MATTSSISISRGEKTTLNFTVTDSPVPDISGWTIKFTVAKAANSPSKLLSIDGQVTVGPEGKFSVTIPGSQANIKPGVYYFDVWRMDADHEKILALGPFTVTGVARLPA